MITVPQNVQPTRGNAGRRKVVKGHAPTKPVPRIPWISKLMALAVQFDRMLRDGTVANQTDVAKLPNVSRPRMTQILNLNLLTPDIQEELLFPPVVKAGRDSVHEKMLRAVVAEVCWGRQGGVEISLSVCLI